MPRIENRTKCPRGLSKHAAEVCCTSESSDGYNRGRSSGFAHLRSRQISQRRTKMMPRKPLVELEVPITMCDERIHSSSNERAMPADRRKVRRLYRKKRKRLKTNASSSENKLFDCTIEASERFAESSKDYYDSYLVIDFEATCERKGVPNPQEIIEFPIIEVDASRKSIISEFHSYVRPIGHPSLSQFCTTLTGIEQGQVDIAPALLEVLRDVEEWMKRRNLLPQDDNDTDMSNLNVKKFLLITCGRWDFDKALPRNFQWYIDAYAKGEQEVIRVVNETGKEVSFRNGTAELPDYYGCWYDLKDSFRTHYNTRSTPSFRKMLDYMNIELVGRHHSGIDDSRNMARMLIKMLNEGYRFPRHKFYDGRV